MAVDLFLDVEAIDVHVESFIWTRLFRYDLSRWHDRTPLGDRFFGQADLPRMQAIGLAGAVMSIATNPFRSTAGRVAACRRNVEALRERLIAGGVSVVADAAGYRRARAGGTLACFVAMQGGNALRPDDLADDALKVVSRITLVHLTRSRLGSPSAPGGRGGGLTDEGRRFVEAMRAQGIILDLAHASPPTFWQALVAHGAGGGGPVIVSHTGVRSERRSWRNVDDAQIRAIAQRGGVVGIMFHRGFLARPSWRATAADVVRHVEHVIRVGGEDAAALGSDYDGMIQPPRDLATVLELPRLVEHMLGRGFSPERVRKVLGANYLRVVEAIRPGVAQT
ncbi:MAG: dipeptidase [Acidimicrobiales bacterium]